MIWAYVIFKVDERKASFLWGGICCVCERLYGEKLSKGCQNTSVYVLLISHVDSVVLYTYYVILVQFQLP